MTSPFLSVFTFTFVLEDAALATAAVFVADGKMTFFLAFICCFAGIALGDVGLYLLGASMRRFPCLNRLPILKKSRNSLAGIHRPTPAFTYSLFLSRIVPGTRLPTYLAAGYLGYPLIHFVVVTVISVAPWVLLVLMAGRSVMAVFKDHWLFASIILLAGLHAAKSVLPQLFNHWDRMALFSSWRKWTHFEFWPAWFFYLPLVPMYLALGIKHKSLLAPFYAAPGFKHGGLLGESKWDFLKHLNPSDESTLKSILFKAPIEFNSVKNRIDESLLHYPLIVKPDVGQRGFGVRIIRNESELSNYLELVDFDLVAQQLSVLPREAGVFYIRRPSEEKGILFSITDKKFPKIIGDGKTTVGDLILADARAKIIASVYFERHRPDLDRILGNGEELMLSECGNHCQGAIFLNGNNLRTPELLEKIEGIARSIPHFYFGRFDIRYRDPASLKAGQQFEVVEINGSGSEATHIWDASTRLGDAYRTLLIQWATLFEIGSEMKKRDPEGRPVEVLAFLKECVKVAFRKNRLSRSS